MTREDVVEQLELAFMKHFRVEKPMGEWVLHPARRHQQIYLKLRFILSWLSGVRVIDMADRHVFAYAFTVMEKYRYFTLYMMDRGYLPYYSTRARKFRNQKFK